MFKSIIVLCVLTFFIQNSLSQLQDIEGISKRAERLVTYLNDNHLRPRDLNDSFAKDIHEYMLSSLDEGKQFFLQEDIDNLTTMSTSIDNEIKLKSVDYLIKIDSVLQVRQKQAEDVVNAFLDAKKMDLFKKTADYKETYRNYSENKNEFIKRWEEQTLKTVHDEILSLIENQNQLNPSYVDVIIDSIILKTKKTYSKYFKSISNTNDYMELIYLNAIAKSFDPHSSFFNTNLNKEFKEELSSQRVIFGISYQMNLDSEIEIKSIVPGSSAWYSDNIQVGDVIKRINSEDGQTIDVSNASVKALGNFFNDLKTDSIVLELIGIQGEKKHVELVKSVVYSDGDVIKSAILEGDKKIGYISLPDFYTNWTDTTTLGCANDIAKALLKLQRENIEGLILDLRNNGGGSIREAIDIVGIFINYGPVVIEESENGDVFTYKDFNRGSIYNGPLIVLVNRRSASASEIVAGAIQNHNRGIVVGERTFGKATGQYIQSLDPTREFIYSNLMDEDPSWGYVKVTNIGLYRINKKSLQGIGITPDVQITHTEQNSFYENDYPNWIKLDSISKKVYYKPKPKIEVGKINYNYKKQKGIAFNQTNELIAKLGVLKKQLDNSIQLEPSFQLREKIDAVTSKLNNLQEDAEIKFIPKSFLFNQQVLDISRFLRKYNEDFLDRLSHDLELNEVFKIMDIYIGIQ